MSFIQTNPVFAAVTNASSASLNNAIIQGHKINETETEDSITALDYAILTLKYSMVKHILVYVNLLLPSEKSKMLNSGLKNLIKCMDKYVNTNKEEDLSNDMIVFNDLKEAGADLSIVINNEEMLYLYHYAVKLNNVDLFNTLISNNIDSNVYDIQGYDPLTYAFFYERVNFIPSLITKSIGNSSGDGPIFNNLTNVQRFSKKSFLHYAVERDYFEISIQLLTLAPELLYMKDDDSKTVLHYVVEKYTKETANKYIDYFTSVAVDVPSFVNLQDFRGDTALHYAILKDNSNP